MGADVPLKFATSAGWAVVRPTDDLPGWAAARADGRAGKGLRRRSRHEQLLTYWTGVSRLLFAPPWQTTAAAFVLMPADDDGAVGTVLHYSRHDGPHPVALGGLPSDDVITVVGGATPEPFGSTAGEGVRVLGDYVQPAADGDGQDGGRYVGYFWWFPDAGTSYALTTVYADLVVADRDLPHVEALARSAERLPEGGSGAVAPAVVPEATA